MTQLGRIGDLHLRDGAILRDAALAYTTLGTLDADRGNVVLATHGYTSSHMFVGGPGVAASEGGWHGLIGPGQAIDTDRYFIVSSNMLGSSFGSTAPMTRNPETGRAYGPDFPRFSVHDIVAAQKQLLASLGIDRLVAVVGPSYGGFQAFTWAADHPDAMRGIVAAVSGFRSPREVDPDALVARLATDPNWNGGHYYEAGGIDATMTAIREETLRNYGIEAGLAARFPDKAARDAEIRRQAAAWAKQFDGHSLAALGRAANAYDVEPDIGRIRARVLYVLSRTDRLFPPSLAPHVIGALQAAGVDARYVEIDTEAGHLASGMEAAKWADELRAFMRSLD